MRNHVAQAAAAARCRPCNPSAAAAASRSTWLRLERAAAEFLGRGSSSSSIDGSGSAASASASAAAFDRNLKRLQRDNAARARRRWDEEAAKIAGKAAATSKSSAAADPEIEIIDYTYFRQELAARLVDRLDDIRRDGGFPLALDWGSGPCGHVHRAICADDSFDGPGCGGIGGVRKLVQLDSSEGMLSGYGISVNAGDKNDGGNHPNQNENGNTSENDSEDAFEGCHRCSTYRLHADEEITPNSRLPFPDGTFDLILSSASLHWINDLPAALAEMKRILKPDGCLLFAMVGGSTLPELRSSLVLAETEREGGISTHVGPFVDFADVGRLLTNAGFTLPTVDVDTIKLGYPNAMVLCEHLQRMGESNACVRRKQGRVSADTFLAAACVYDDLYRLEVGEGVYDDEAVEASVQIIYAIGWSPHDSQQKPKERGSASHKIGNADM